ncbi:hypothetical protein SAMN05216252_15319 [Actinacidiphila glaucinigra]|uniref:Uncharacterized protein n=2 Tax=Actinacidiphila glaucinigra TaxID=235986 RepID=A0A239NYD5_9ACTN|nr:hypothetical protein SAMN05216252_15319 [Actinacidiphila glaucinigra]
MHKAARTVWWESLPTGIRNQIDGYVLQDSFLSAVKAVVDVGLVTHGIGVGTAQLLVSDRYLHYGERIARTPESPLDPESLAYRAAGCPGRIVAIEAIWDGDTVHDWFVVLLAITAGPREEHVMATVYRSTAERYLARTEHPADGTRRRQSPRGPAEPWLPTCRFPSTSPAPTLLTTRPLAGSPSDEKRAPGLRLRSEQRSRFLTCADVVVGCQRRPASDGPVPPTTPAATS